MPLNSVHKKNRDAQTEVGSGDTGFNEFVDSNLPSRATGDGSFYDDLFNANPYNNLTYNRSGWQSILSSLGFRTDYDRWLEEQQVNKNEYDAQVAQIKMQNEYNSPANQAQMMKLAGQNPDILGTQGVSDSASPVQDVNGMSPGVADDFAKVQQFGSAIMSFVQVGFGLAKDVMTFKQMNTALNNQDVDLAKNFMTFANQYVLNQAPLEPFNNDKQWRDYTDKIINGLSGIGFDITRNRRQRKIWQGVINPTFFNSENFKQVTSNWLNSGKNLEDISRLSKPFDFNNPNPWKAFDDISVELGKFADQAYRALTKASTMQNTYNSDYFQNLDPSAMAGAQNEQALQLKQSSQIDRLMNSTMQRIVRRLHTDAMNGDQLASGLLLAMQIFRMSRFSFGPHGISGSLSF